MNQSAFYASDCLGSFLVYYWEAINFVMVVIIWQNRDGSFAFQNLWYKLGEEFLDVNRSGMKHVESIVVCTELDAFFELSLFQGVVMRSFFPITCLNF